MCKGVAFWTSVAVAATAVVVAFLGLQCCMQSPKDSTMEAYQSLWRLFARLHSIQHAAGILEWDMQTYMPSKSGEARGAAKAELDLIAHQLMTEPKNKVWLDAVMDPQQATVFNTDQKANIREMFRVWNAENKLYGLRATTMAPIFV